MIMVSNHIIINIVILIVIIIGAILTITSALQSLASVGASILFNKVYHPQSVVNGHTVNAGIVFWIAAGIWVAVIPLIM